MTRYADIYAASQSDPEAFWAEAASAVDWTRAPEQVLDDSAAPFYRWFADAEGNTCYNAIDRHVDAGRGAQPAIIHDSPVTGGKTVITYSELLDSVSRLAGVLANRGVGKGDRVVIYMPMIPEALVAMLACARIGAVHSVVFGGFAAHELAVRINDATPKAVLSASCGIEGSRIIAYKPLLDAAIEQSDHKPDFTVILQRPQVEAAMLPGRDVNCGACRLHARGRRRPALYPLHIRHHRPAEGRRPPQWRAYGGAALDDEESLQREGGRRLLGRLRRGLGGRPQLHLLRAAAGRLHHGRLRRQTGGHT